MDSKLLAFGKFVPNGDGSYNFRPLAPVEWLSVTEAAKVARVSRSTMLNWVRFGTVRSQRKGPKLLEIAADSLPDMKIHAQHAQHAQ